MSTSVLAGTKRKRYVPVERDVSVKLAGKLHHGLREVRKAARKAKVFETQRLVKKLKDLRKPGRNIAPALEEIQDLETQLESLKTIDHEQIAHLALSTKIRKEKALSSNEILLPVLASAIPAEIKTAPERWHAKVGSRLLSSKVLAGEVGSVVISLRAVLDPDAKVKPGGGLTEKAPVAKEELESGESEDVLGHHAKRESDLTDGNVRAEVEDMVEAEGLVMDEVDDVADDDDWESGSIDDGETSSGSEDEGSLAPSPKRLKPTRTKSASPEARKAEAASTFLPSLSVGFLKGDSDSDFSESEAEGAEPGRKNRRGQRARQAIWEKKYGKNAKHVKKQREQDTAAATAKQLGKHTDSGWDGHRKPPPTHGTRRPSRAATQSQGRPSRDAGAERPTHPSWEAKKRLKEKESAKILPSQGKKIVFT